MIWHTVADFGQEHDGSHHPRLMHRYGGLAVFDYACAAPYVVIDANPEGGDGACAKDALYFSTHKFVGGVQGPGVLVAKKRLFTNEVPHGGGCKRSFGQYVKNVVFLIAGGGTVAFVTRHGHRYLDKIEEREEGGTPAIVESVRMTHACTNRAYRMFNPSPSLLRSERVWLCT